MQAEERPVRAPSVRPYGLAEAVAGFAGTDLSVAIEFYDGSRLGPADARPRIMVRSRDAVRYLVTAPGELGLARAFVSGAIDIEGDIFDVLALRDNAPAVKMSPREWV